jgi:peptide deformylase
MNHDNEMLKGLNEDSTRILNIIPELTYVGNQILRTKTSDVSLEEGLIIGQKLLTALLKYRELTGLGVGLAAPQIGVSANVFVTHTNGISKIYINPKITLFSEEKNMYKECCLSSGHFWCDVERSKTITLSYMNEEGVLLSEDLTDRAARLIQHEYDHVQGIVNVDKAVMGTIDYRFGDPKEQRLRE